MTNQSSDDPSSLQFPWKLVLVLKHAEKNKDTHIISWLPNGRAFMVYDKDKFSEDIMPRYFQSTKYKSFQRSLNLWGFFTETRQPTNRGAICHPNFLRDYPAKCHLMKRVRVKGSRTSCSSIVGESSRTQTALQKYSSQSSVVATTPRFLHPSGWEGPTRSTPTGTAAAVRCGNSSSITTPSRHRSCTSRGSQTVAGAMGQATLPMSHSSFLAPRLLRRTEDCYPYSQQLQVDSLLPLLLTRKKSILAAKESLLESRSASDLDARASEVLAAASSYWQSSTTFSGGDGVLGMLLQQSPVPSSLGGSSTWLERVPPLRNTPELASLQSATGSAPTATSTSRIAYCNTSECMVKTPPIVGRADLRNNHIGLMQLWNLAP